MSGHETNPQGTEPASPEATEAATKPQALYFVLQENKCFSGLARGPSNFQERPEKASIGLGSPDWQNNLSFQLKKNHKS